ncbi:carboxylate--amine ligase [Cellulomonas wangsupingiae]|uniref:Carboxylate--amine ligase n=1 Tax=Cellulomonas wangsupingiae TaxID=2968085 RepID=A0ABY5KA59_9CELL|nr:carboxylate--amine ligase [Cellulomonas wangsupingiae]MCC2333094.1 carboxylate--amine ligase [Cellulomonas wangsupingiae]MCM0640453.1 carboxylate--amine ligase [Cellulomonas wangsupingiae]UUI66810.1 carboxylate--amine ligase [Cellulomonas wangsupingiae]
MTRATGAQVPVAGLQPVILGGDVGAYSLARTFHEAYGVRPVVVSSVSTGLVRHSRILENVVEPGIDDGPTVVRRLRAIAEQHPGTTRVLLGSADWLVRTIVENRAQLEDLYTIPYVDVATLDKVTDKVLFGELCAELGIDHPATVVHDVQAGGTPDTSALRFPVIAKAADTAAYHLVEFPGKKKVFTVDTPAELADLLRRVRASGYQGRFVVQDLIPGDDSGMRILTCYSDAAGKVRFSAFGHVLLEEHTPGALGNPAGIITGHDEQIVAQAVRLLEHLGWTGYANFDLKYDPRDGRTVFFELNPRLGRSNFYITAGGRNTAELYVREHVQGLDPLPDGAADHLTQPHLYTVLPRWLLRRYVADPALRARTRALGRAGRATNPLWYRAETDPRRLAYLAVAQANQVRKYRRYYPRGDA